ncbi:uncharacterized protein LOC114520187 [Dendronephthya gigantea]|uniref:uncharacterized protein LOC114520187 n=1 Tax=Dendronephthya gigantea TaxID=151771 RepID=UPI00106AE3D6|nr:uncharacterized protein LOC114520187 [Dendronephthya gigantea]
MITSTLPGLGKTERIRREIQEKKMNAATFSISGPFEPSKLIERLKKLKLRKYHCLHLDIGEVSDPLLLDTFLFQLIVTGMVSAGMQFYHLPTTHIYIEIANTLKDWLLESLVVSKYFTRIRLEWQNYKNLLVSPEITSNIQVVCQYLDIFDRTCMELEEVQFSGATKSKPLSARRCQDLLAKYYSSDADITFTTLHRFLGVLASQLSKFSESAFFKIANLKSMMGDKGHSVRSNLFGALLKVSKEFASRAINTCRSSDKKNLSQEESAKAFDEAMVSTATSAKDMVDWVTGMIKWKEWNDFFVVFHGLNSQAITAMYWNRSLVPEGVEMLLKSQGVGENEELEDFNCFTQEQLQKKLEKIACSKPVERSNLFQGYRYALTPDNILKMILIILRVRANIPIIIMGETGCGKTSLVRYLAKTCGVQFHTFNFHAGISEKDIVAFISMINERNEEMWILLDEINTCDHLGLINDIMCHHSLCGRRLSKNLVFLAACNPYKLRPQEHIRAAGLEGKNITDEYSGLVYPVHPLPEAMIDYVWDYGALSPEDERNYIKRMVRDLPKKYEGMLVDLLAVSQNLIRNVEKNHFCVSLRDVNRCIHLISWFNNMLKTRQELKENKVEYPSHLQQYHSISQQYKNDPTTKSIVLALAHCYLSRLPTAELRRDYRESMMYIFSNNKIQMTYDANVDTFTAIVRMEEEDYLERMDLPPGTARNAALRENMFVMLVCILNRIPIFVVGKPGCSKSLSIQLIRSNLRGRDSRDPLFRQLPQLYVVSYQGSESSTSEGIMKVFEKARKYKDYNKDGNVLPVVLLDEVGLAENSKYNPLKVLHSLLEPGEGKLPDVAIVGISDWSLDAAKMNRAIHLSRPELNKEDLYEIGHSLHYADEGDDSQHLRVEELRCLAEAYFEYQAQQRHANFHGLRDYYSLIKSLTGSSSFQQVNISLQRNFGGLPGEVTNIQKIFLDKLKTFMVSSGQDIIPITQLIQENLSDPYARHLMLITNGDLALGILKQSLAQLEKETITIFGSRFEEDLSEEYSYRILSRVILCMERDCILILKDLESIYGSLYDMLNQNYTVVGNRKDCRVALGAYSNPMCQVNDGFRCIVLVDQHKVNYSDPPFLNRFEKQLLRFSDVLTEDQKGVINELNRWVGGISTVEGLQSHFHVSDVFIGFHEDTLPSLVLSHSHDADSSTDVLKKCKDDLMWVASPDGVLRMQKCNFLKEDSSEVQDLSDEYFRKPLHHGFPAFFEHVVANHQESSFFASDEIGSKTIVMTFANIHTDIRQCLGNGVRCQVERLSAYKSEKQLAERISQFWNASEKELLVLQCKPDLDGTHLLLARSIIEEKRDAYKQWLHETESKAQGFKHVCIVVHVQRGEENANSIRWQFSFLCGWRQVFLDVLEAPLVPLNEILDCSQLVENKDNLDENGELNQSVRQQQLERFAKMITDQVPELDSITTHFHILYMTDIFDMMTADFRLTLPRSQRVALVQAVFTSEVKQGFPAKDMPEFFALLHTFAWVHREEILDMLKMIDHCRLFIELSVLLKITDDILGSSKEVMLAEIDETESNPQVDSQTETLNENLETAENTESDGELESNEDPSEQSEAKLADIDLEFEKPSSENEDNEEEVIEEIMDDPGDSTEKIGDVLVTLYCEMMFPSPEVVEKSGSPELWMRNANLLLSLALKISEHSPAFHYLRLCVDFLRINFISDELPLCTLSEIATTLSPEYLDHEDSFETITEQLIRPLEEEMKGNRHKREALQKFSALFYGRCIDTNVDTCGVSPIVKEVLSLERPELVLKMSPVVLRLLMVEQMQSPGIFKNLIDNPSVMDNCPCLQNIDEVFSDLFSNGLIHHDSYPSVMTCDLIESQLDFKNDFGISDLNSSDCEVLVLAKSAVNVIAQNGEDACGIRVFSSVAFLRGFFTMLAQFIAANPGVIDKGSPYVPVITEVNSLLKDAKSTLPTFFLKQLRENAGIFDLQKWFGENSVLSSIEELWANEKYEDKSVFTTVLKHPEYKDAMAAYCKLMSNDKQSMQKFLSKCCGSHSHAFALLGILINMVYLKRAVRKLAPKEEKLVDWFQENVPLFSSLFQELLLRIIGRKDFHCPELQLSPESSVDDVEFALLVLHIACVVATGALNENLPFYCYVTNPVKFKQPLVLAHCEEELHSIFKYKPYLMDSVLATCQCGVRLAFNSEVNEAKCPRCHEILSDETESGTSATQPLSFHCGASLESDLCAKHMCPAVYRALHLVVYSSYYAGVALGTSNKENLSSVLNVLNAFGPDSDPVKTCVKTIRDDLSHLMKILSCKRDVAIKTMHLVLEKSSDLITSNSMLGANDCSTQEGRRGWEVEFSHLTEPVFLKLREALENMQVSIKLQQTNDNQENLSLECRILELDNYPNEPTEQNQQLKRLFRATKQPCFEDFRSAFLHSPKEIQSKHSFLALFFAKFEQLPIIGHLHHLLKWSRLVSSALTHRISRKDAESKSINDFISGHLLELERSPQELESLRLLFDSFKEAWNETRPLVNQALAEKELDKMPWLVKTDCIAYCLMESDFGVYLKEAVGILVSYQNSILDVILSLSSSHLQPALSVFEEDHGSSVACVTIQEVKEKEIICFQWFDADLLRYGQNNLEYGKGRKITYDFERIEMWLASKIVFGKCFLTGALTRFIFAKELFHSCGQLLTEIRKLVKQNPILPEEVCKGLAILKERRIKEAQDLLQHIEVLIFLLKRKLKTFNVDMTLEELAEEWTSMLPSPFPVSLLPEPRSSIKIKHVAALYEALEDLLVDGAIDGLADQFRYQLPIKMKEAICAVLAKDVLALKPPNFLKALRRFVFRYLSSETERYWPEERKSLQSCLDEPSLWSPLPLPNLDEIPREITLENIHSTVKYIEEVEKERKASISRRPGLRSSPRQPQKIKQPGKSARRRVENFN